MLLIFSVNGSSIISCEVIIGYLGIYPLAALGGAASLVPGGIGVTEVGMSALIQKVGPSVGILDAITVAFIFRVYSFWLVGLISFLCVFCLEKSLNNRGN